MVTHFRSQKATAGSAMRFNILITSFGDDSGSLDTSSVHLPDTQSAVQRKQ